MALNLVVALLAGLAVMQLANLTTTVYLHLTSSVMRPVQETINALMADL